MAQKESSHREIVDGLNEELATIRKQHDELTTLSRDQVCVDLSLHFVLTDKCLDPQYVC